MRIAIVCLKHDLTKVLLLTQHVMLGAIPFLSMLDAEFQQLVRNFSSAYLAN